MRIGEDLMRARGWLIGLVLAIAFTGLNGEARNRDAQKNKGIPRSQCVSLLTDSTSIQKGIEVSRESIAESTRGRPIYQKLKALTAVNPTGFADMRGQAVRDRQSRRDYLKFIRDDRKRLIAGVQSLIVNEAANLPDLRQMLVHTYRHLTEDERKNETDTEALNRMLTRCGKDCGKPMLPVYDTENWDDQFEYFARQYYGKNYSFLSELMTALEVRGFTGIGFHSHEMFPEALQERLLNILKGQGQERLANLEIDTASFDPVNQRATWFEVKHVGTPIMVDEQHWVARMQERVQTIQKFFSIVQRDPELKALWPYKTDIRFVIRGAGISSEMIERLRKQYGIIAYNGSPEEYNATYGVKSTAGKK